MVEDNSVTRDVIGKTEGSLKHLIIGGAGFIGVNTASRLARMGEDVHVLDNFSRPGSRHNRQFLESHHPDVRITDADIRHDRGALNAAVSEADVVYHLAAQVAVTLSVTDPRHDFEVNALGTFNVLEAVRKAENRAILLYASTNKVYGGMENVGVLERNGRYEYADLAAGVDEKMPLDFHSPYGCSKGAGDQYVRDYHRIYGVKSVVLRQSCIYGPHQFGMEDQGWIAWFTIAALTGRPITVYGDGKQIRDVLHVDDLIDLYLCALRSINECAGEIYNVGGGPRNTLSLLELLSILENKLDRKIPVLWDEWRPGDQRVFVSNIDRARKKLSWNPKYDVEHGVSALIEWSRCNTELFDANS